MTMFAALDCRTAVAGTDFYYAVYNSMRFPQSIWIIEVYLMSVL